MGKTLIRVECIDQRLILTSAPAIASGGRNEDEIEFSFCSLWAGFAKTAVFFRDKNVVYHVPVTNDKCVIPHEVLASEGVMYLGVFGVSGDIRRTSDTLRYYVEQGAITESGLPSDPNSDIYKKYLDNLAEMEQATRAANTAASAANTATASAKTATASANTAAAAANEAARLAPKPLALTQEGQPAQIWPDAGSPLRPKITMLPIQSGSGDPSPDNVRPISGRTAVTVTTCGKNLCPPFEQGGLDLFGTGGPVNGGADDSKMRTADFIAVVPGVTYALSRSKSDDYIQMAGYGADKSYIGPGSQVLDKVTRADGSPGIVANPLHVGETFCTFSVKPGVYFIKIIDVSGDLTNQYQLELGGRTAYEPYQGETFTLALGRTVYGGILDVASGTLTVTHTLTTMKDKNWSESGKENGRFLWNNSRPKINTAPICDVLPGRVWNANSGGAGLWELANNTGDQLIVRTDLSTDDEWKAWLEANDPRVCYELDEPEIIQLSPAFIAALEGANIVSVDANGLELTYNKSLVREREELLARIAALEAAVVNNA